jgi:WD40 repeat protein
MPPTLWLQESVCVGLLLMLGLLQIGAATLNAANLAPPDDTVIFSRDIAPVLVQKCVTCHGPEKAKGKYRADSFEALLKPGSSGELPVVPGELARSHLFQLLTAKDSDDRMPQKDDPLPAAQIALLERWIKDGAKFDGPDPKKPFTSFSATGPQPDPPASYVRPVPVLALAFGGDGKELAAGGYHEITIWDAANGTLLRRIKNVAQQTQALAFSPGGALLAAASGTPGKIGEVKLFNPGTGALLQTLVTGGDIMLALAFSPDGQQLATAGSDNTVRLFDVATGQQLFAVEQHADAVKRSRCSVSKHHSLTLSGLSRTRAPAT